MTDDVLKQINAAFARLDEENREQSARLSAMRFLLEDVYAEAHKGRPEHFTARMERLPHLTRTAAVKGDPGTEAAFEDQKIRITTHLQRFQLAVSPRIIKRG